MNKKISPLLLVVIFLAAVPLAEAQQPNVNRVGVILAGGSWYEAIEGSGSDYENSGLKRKNNLVWQSEILRAT